MTWLGPRPRIACRPDGGRPCLPSLRLRAPGDRRTTFVAGAVGQRWVAEAPAIVVIGVVEARLREKMGERGLRFGPVEVGLAAQGFLLEAVNLGLAATFVGGFDPPEVARALDLPAGEEPLSVLPVGRPKSP